MEEEFQNDDISEPETKSAEVTYRTEKDFYKGISGELRFKAEGLFKKAKEKGISIDDIEVTVLKESQVEFPGIGAVDLPAFMIKVRGKHLQSGQVMTDGKQIDYYNIYQKYVADKIERKNILRDERGRVIKEGNKPKLKAETDLTITDWERFEIGRDVIDDKEFGMEKTITGACDRLIRKLMGENDWLYPGEARLLDDEFNKVQSKIAAEQEQRKSGQTAMQKKATDRQINYLKSKVKNLGADPDNEQVMREIIRHAGFDYSDVRDLTTGDMSKVIDNIGAIVPKVRETLGSFPGLRNDIKQ